MGTSTCQDPLGDWTVYGPTECGQHEGARCLDGEGDWTTWAERCSHTAMRTREAAPAPEPKKVDGCDCSWAVGPWGCGTYDGTECWNACCPREPACDCAWAKLPDGCGDKDGTACWSSCCAQDSAECNCDWAENGGCSPSSSRDGTKCWDHCCLAYGGPMRFWQNAAVKLSRNPGASAAAKVCASLAGVAAVGGILASRTYLRRRWLWASTGRELIRDLDANADVEGEEQGQGRTPRSSVRIESL